MIRKMSGLLKVDEWSGLNHQKDYPNVIGNSTTKHVEYLIKTYRKLIKQEETIKSFIEAVIWTLKKGKSEQRKKEVQELLFSLGLNDVIENLIVKQEIGDIEFNQLQKILREKVDFKDSAVLVKIGIEIYYQHYHQYLLSLSESFVKNSSGHKLIEPLPGVSVFLALIKGLLGDEAENLAEFLISEFKRKNPETTSSFELEEVKLKLKNLGIYFEKNPLKVAVVTSSIYYEADIVLSEVFRQIKEKILNWNISEKRKLKILEKFSSYKSFYDAVVTATDAYEFRLKPFRDLYSIALYRLGIDKQNFSNVIGFEDSESGTIAIRSAGIGCCIAVPFPQTKNHNLQAASYILLNGLPEFILKLNCLIDLE
jgi:beta-phosphoglucomutase-like phosphatase (HAD superfamily)